jgi:hypothetical protein
MEFKLSTSYNLCDMEEEFDDLIMDYPELKKYNTKYDSVNKKTLIIIREDEILQFIKDIDEDVFISYNRKIIIIADKAI